MKKILVLAGAALAILLWARSGCSQDLSWSAVLKGVRAEFGDVTQISTDSLAAWMADSSRAQPVLIDARTPEEYAVSHIEGAVRVDPDNPVLAASEIRTDAPIVAYCSVGYRSSSVAQQLAEQGYTNVVNLEGSIFKWANEGRPLVAEGQPTDTVHPFNAVWGRLLSRDVPRDQ